jgi:hypothetical protein
MFFGGPTNIQNIPENGETRTAQNGVPTSATIFWKPVCEYAIRSIMLLFHYNKKSSTKA